MPRILLYVAMTLDGFIARPDGSVDFLDPYNGTGEDYGYAEFFSSVHSVIMGNTTYRQFGHTPQFTEEHEGKPVYVFSRSEKGTDDHVTFVDGDIKAFVEGLEGDAWLVGGAALLEGFLTLDLVDEFIITVIPALLGEGIPLFTGASALRLELRDVHQYGRGVVQLRYVRRGPGE